MQLPEKRTWIVRLGQMEWSRFTYERPRGDPIELLGSVCRGPQIGALAVTEGDQYVQVVGDHMTPLNRGQIKKAIAQAGKGKFEWRPFQRQIPSNTRAPVVVVKRHRKFVMP